MWGMKQRPYCSCLGFSFGDEALHSFFWGLFHKRWNNDLYLKQPGFNGKYFLFGLMSMWGMVSNTWGYPRVFLQTVCAVQLARFEALHHLHFFDKQVCDVEACAPPPKLLMIKSDMFFSDEHLIWWCCWGWGWCLICLYFCSYFFSSVYSQQKIHPKKWSSQSLWFKKMHLAHSLIQSATGSWCEACDR